MEDDQLAVGGQLDVELDHVGALSDRQLEARQAVFERLSGYPPVADDPGWIPIDHLPGAEYLRWGE